jgi:hypothetical protein
MELGEPVAAGLMRPVREQPDDESLQIELVDEDGKPIGGVEYEVEISGAPSRSGTLNGEGWAHIADIPSGAQVQVTFPELDDKAWERG